MPAAATQNGGQIEFVFRPNFRRVSRKFGVTFVTRKPVPTALELDRDDVAFFVIMGAARLIINVHAADACAMNNHVHLARSRGQSSTRIDAIVQHPIMKIKPLRNEPLR